MILANILSQLILYAVNFKTSTANPVRTSPYSSTKVRCIPVLIVIYVVKSEDYVAGLTILVWYLKIVLVMIITKVEVMRMNEYFV